MHDGGVRVNYEKCNYLSASKNTENYVQIIIRFRLQTDARHFVNEVVSAAEETASKFYRNKPLAGSSSITGIMLLFHVFQLPFLPLFTMIFSHDPLREKPAVQSVFFEAQNS